MAGTVVTYNGVELRNVLTSSWQETVHMDESNTDEIYVTIVARFQGLVFPGSMNNLGISATGNNATAAAGFNQVAQLLSQPRGDFSVSWGPDNVLTVVGSNLESQQRDVNNGPKPKLFSIQNVAGSRCITVEWEVELSIPRCGGNSVGDPKAMAAVLGKQEVLSNRWSATETKDENFYSTLEYDGILVVRRITQNADLFRAVVVPPLLPGFQRMQCVFNSSPDGLHLHYKVRDVQQFASPPPPATSWDCKYTIETNNGASIFSTVQVSLTGPPGTDQRQLLVAALQVVEARLGNLRQAPVPADPKGQKPPRNVFVRQATIVEDVANNKVTVVVRAEESPLGRDLPALLRLPLDEVGAPITGVEGYQKEVWPVADLYNSAVGAFAFQLANPCKNQIPSLAKYVKNDPPDKKTPPPPPNPPYKTPVANYRSEDVLRDYKLQISAAQQAAPYVYVEIVSRYKTSPGFYQLPIAISGATANDDTSAVVELHSPVCYRELQMRAERTFTWPQLPDAPRVRKDLNGITEYLVEEIIVPVGPHLQADGKNYIYEAQIKLTYALSRKPTASELLIAGSSPIDLTTGLTSSMPVSALSDKNIQGGGT